MVPLERYADVFARLVARRVAVVFHVAGGRGVEGVVAAEADVFAGEPEGAALAVEDVAWDHVLVCQGVSMV